MSTATANLAIFGDPVQENAVEQIQRVMRDERVVAGALMADHHRGYSLPVGGVVKYDGYVSPSAVGYDIACGNKAVRTNLKLADLHSAETRTPQSIVKIVYPLDAGHQQSDQLRAGRLERGAI